MLQRKAYVHNNILSPRILLLTSLLTLSLTAPSSAAPKLILGIHPYLAAAELYKRFTPLAEYLGKKLGSEVSIRVSSTYEAHVASVDSGEIDIAFMGPAPYVQLTGKSGPVPLLAAFESNGSHTFRGVVAVRKESNIKKLSQLSGKSFAFGPAPSTMSNIVPRAMLLKAGVSVDQLGKAEYMTNHDNIALSVLAGRFEAGALKEDIFRQYESQGLRALAISDPVPDHLFVARRGLAGEMVNTLRQSLLSLHQTEEGRQILAALQSSLTALVPPVDADYDRLRAMINSLDQ